MAIGKASDFIIYQEYLQTRIAEILAQNGDAFNAASQGAIRLSTISRRGDYEQASFFKNISGLVTRRDNTSTATVTDLAMTMEELISVKLSRKIGPVAQTRDAFKKLVGRFDPTLFTGILATEAANAMQIEMLNTVLAALAAALKQQTSSYFLESSMGAISTNTLVNTLKKVGDRADRIVCWIMHSKPYYDLVLSQIAANITGVSNFNIAQGTPLSLNRPIIVTDSASLVTQLGSPDINNYYTLGLVADAAVVENTEEEEVVIQDVTGTETLSVRYQGEYAYNLGLRGFKWDTTNGGVNPLAAAITTGTNWDTAFADVKDRAGVLVATL